MDKALKSPETQYPLEPLFGRILSPFERFLRGATAGGVVLILCTVLTLVIANSSWGTGFAQLWQLPLTLSLADFHLTLSLHQWINDGLMALFFLLVGLEIKREVLVGELATWREAALPVLAALGGMLVPAAIYLLFNSESPARAGWGIPTATDIAFAVGILVLLSKRVPRNLILFLTALAIADDLGAVLVIALFYSHGLNIQALAAVGALAGTLFMLNRGGVRHVLPYAVLGLLLWYAMLLSGIHATLAGVLLALLIPARPAFTPQDFQQRVEALQQAFQHQAIDPDTPGDPLSNPRMAAIAASLADSAAAVQAPLQRMEHALSPWVTFLIIPLFAIANAGLRVVDFDLSAALSAPVTLGVALGLVLGKFTGISGAAWLAIRLGWARLPRNVAWRHLLGAAWLGGIGFTMSLFISQLAFSDPVLQEEAKLGILCGSAVAALIGLLWLSFAPPPQETS